MSRRIAMLMPIGIIGVVLGLGLVHSRIAEPAYELGGTRLLWEVVYAGALCVAAYAVGFPDVFERLRQVAASAVGAVIAGALTVSMAQLMLGMPLLPRFVVLGSAPFVIGWLALCSVSVRWGRHVARNRDRVVLVGSGEDLEAVPKALASSPERPAEVVAVMDVDDARGTPGSRMPLLDLTREVEGTVVVLDRSASAETHIVEQVALLHERGVRVRTLSLFYESWLGRLPMGELERISLMFDIGEVHRDRFARRKRIVDIAAAVAFLPLLAVVTPLVMVGNILGNRGPLLFRQERVGKSGQTFEMLKFRSMVSVPGSEDNEWTTDDDLRVTPFGGFLRKSHLDELPQIINVLRGELSMVGPRPEQTHYVEQLSEKLPFYQLRHLVQPGLTGWAQINQGYASSTGDALEKLQYEFWYLRHQGMAVDLRILVRTLRSVIGGDGR